MNINDRYEELIEPSNFVMNFPDMDAFRGWCMRGSLSDLRDTRTAFERADMFEHLPIIQAAIDCRVDEYLEGFGFE